MEGAESTPKDSNKVFIHNSQLLHGFYVALHNAEHFYKTATSLYNQKDYQSSIPLATISIEEALKGYEMLIKFRKNLDITEEDWQNLTNHKHKLTNVFKFAADVMKKEHKPEDLDAAKKEFEKRGVRIPDGADKELSRNLEKRAFVYSHFQMLREGCFYADWDKSKGIFTYFDELTPGVQEALSFYILMEAESTINSFKASMETYVNALRETGQLLFKLPYPSYVEFRTPDKFESNSLMRELSKLERTKMDKGYRALREFIAKKSFEPIAYSLFATKMADYLKLIAKQKPENNCQHPLLKSLIMAINQATSKGPNTDNIAAISSDASNDPERKGWMYFLTVANMKDGICQIETIQDLGHKDYVYTQDVIEKILRTEIILERYEGNTIPASAYIEALSVVGIKSKMIKNSEIGDAIKAAKKLVEDDKLKNAAQKIIEEIKTVKSANEWDELDTFTREAIVMSYGMEKYPGHDVYMTPASEPTKTHCRLTIISAIQDNFIGTA